MNFVLREYLCEWVHGGSVCVCVCVEGSVRMYEYMSIVRITFYGYMTVSVHCSYTDE